MKQFMFTVPRIKEEVVKEFLERINEESGTKFWAQQGRIGNESLFAIVYEDNEKE